jgi:cell pole-organizing protein PopZ
MAKLGSAQEQTMDEILASIRRMISDDDARPLAVKRVETPAPQPDRPPDNVSRLFASAEDEDADLAIDADSEPEPDPSDNVVELAIAQAMEEARAEVENGETEPESVVSDDPPQPAAEPARAVAAPRMPPADDRHAGPPLMSKRTDTAVTNAFNRLATTMLSGSARTIDELVEDLLRPMLRSWLDDNLPPLVERLVREEIERVARGRR